MMISELFHRSKMRIPPVISVKFWDATVNVIRINHHHLLPPSVTLAASASVIIKTAVHKKRNVMKVIEPSVKVHWEQSHDQMLQKLEEAGKKAHKSEDKIGPGTAVSFVKMLLKLEHMSVLEHVSVSATIVCDRGVMAEFTRHRIGSFSVESTRYCCYSNEKFGNEITVVQPSWFTAENRGIIQSSWAEAMQQAEKAYFTLLAHHCTAQEARSVLPNSLKTEIYVTFNLREWLHFFELRDSLKAHPDMQKIARMLHSEFIQMLPEIFKIKKSAAETMSVPVSLVEEMTVIRGERDGLKVRNKELEEKIRKLIAGNKEY